MIKVTVGKDKLVTLIVAEDALSYIKPALTLEQENSLLIEVAMKLLKNQETEKETYYLKTIYFSNARRDNATAYLAQDSLANFEKPRLYRFNLDANVNEQAPDLWPIVDRKGVIKDSNAKFATMKTPVLKKICSQDRPPNCHDNTITAVLRPNDDDAKKQIARLWLRENTGDTERANEITNYFAGDTQQTLMEEKQQICRNIQTPLQAFTSLQEDNPSLNQSLQTYKKAICESMQTKLNKQLAYIDKSINTNTQQIMDLTNPINKAVNDYLNAKYEYAAICKPLATALHNAAKKYYISRWSAPANRGNPVLLEKERTVFKAIFNGIASIDQAFNLSPVEDIINLFSKKEAHHDTDEKHIKGLQQLLADLLNQSYTKVNPDLFSFLHEELRKFNGEADKDAKYRYFTPFVRHTGIFAVSDHVFTFTPAFVEKHNAFYTYKKLVDDISANQIQGVVTDTESAKERVRITVESIEKERDEDLATAAANIEKFSILLSRQQDIRDKIDELAGQLQIMHAKAEPLTLNPDLTEILHLPRNVAIDLEAHLSPITFAERRAAILGTIEELQIDIMREQKSLAKAMDDAKKTAASLKPLDLDNEITAINRVLNISETTTKAADAMIADAESAWRQTMEVINDLQKALSQQKLLTDFKQDRLRGENPAAEQFKTIAADAEELYKNANNVLDPLLRQVAKLPKPLLGHLSKLKNMVKTEENNTADILRCHFLLSGLLNFKYWESTVSRSKKKALVIDEAGHNHWIHLDIINLLAIVKRLEFSDWNTNADTARALLDEFSSYKTTSKNSAVNRFLEIAKEANHSLTIVSMDIDHHDLINPGMFPAPDSSPLINPARLSAIQTIGKRSFFKRHPWVKTALIIGGLTLGLAAIGVGVYFAVLALPAAVLTALTVGILTLIKTGTLAPIVAGIVTAFAGIGALIGRAMGKRQAAKREAKLLTAEKQDQLASDNINKILDSMNFDDPEEAVAAKPSQPRPAAVGNKKPTPAATAASNNPFDEPEDKNSFAPEARVSKQNMFNEAAINKAVKPATVQNQPVNAATFKDACIRESLALRIKNGALPRNYEIETIVKAAIQHPAYFNAMIEQNPFGLAVKNVLSTAPYKKFDVNLITDNEKFKQFVDQKQQALGKLEDSSQDTKPGYSFG